MSFEKCDLSGQVKCVGRQMGREEVLVRVEFKKGCAYFNVRLNYVVQNNLLIFSQQDAPRTNLTPRQVLYLDPRV